MFFLLCFSMAILSTSQLLAETPKDVLLLTPFLKNNNAPEARLASVVDKTHFLNVTSHAGYLTVDEVYNSNLFFWYFPGPAQLAKPWIIWLQGGPGASSLAGVFDEMGPFQYTPKEGLTKRKWSWTDHYSVLFIDNPVGAGFSFTNSSEGYPTSREMYSDHLYKALQQILNIFPELRSKPLYIAGESYAGHYVPAVAHQILTRKPQGVNAINLQGIMMGNPTLDRLSYANFSEIFYNWGLIDSQGMLACKALQEDYIKAIKLDDYEHADEYWNKLLDKLQSISHLSNSYNVLEDSPDLESFVDYIEKKEIRKALHVGDAKFDFSSSDVKRALKKEFLIDMTAYVEKLLEHYRVLIYCGQLDTMIPCVPNARIRRQNWRWSGRGEFLAAPRLPFSSKTTNKLAGYIKSGGNFTEVLMLGAGHLVPMNKPAETLELISDFMQQEKLVIPPYNKDDLEPPAYVEPTTVPESRTSLYKYVMIGSLVLNALLMCVGATVYFMKQYERRRDFDMEYPFNDETVTEGLLSLS